MQQTIFDIILTSIFENKELWWVGTGVFCSLLIIPIKYLKQNIDTIILFGLLGVFSFAIVLLSVSEDIHEKFKGE